MASSPGGTAEKAGALMSEHLRVVRLSEQDFANMARSWNELLSHSDADPLFMSWSWLYSWWEVWGNALGLELALFGVYENEARLVGLAPFYVHEFRLPIGLRVRRLQFLGNAWRIQGTERTEYSGLIIRRGLEASVTQSLLLKLRSLDWHEMVVCDQNLPELLRWQDAFDRVGQQVTTVPRTVDSGVRVPVSGDFERWLSGLGRNTRLKAYNRRRYLAEKGNLRFREIGLCEAPAFLERLNEFHCNRWGKPCFDEGAVAFHLKLMSRLDDGQLALTALEFEGETVSVLYDIRAGQSRYNLQAGFLEEFDRKVALGTLHLGYAIEESFRNDGILYYDLLAGYGKKSFYKSRFQGETVHFLTTQFARDPLMRRIYRLQSLFPGWLRQGINRWVRL